MEVAHIMCVILDLLKSLVLYLYYKITKDRSSLAMACGISHLAKCDYLDSYIYSQTLFPIKTSCLQSDYLFGIVLCLCCHLSWGIAEKSASRLGPKPCKATVFRAGDMEPRGCTTWFLGVYEGSIRTYVVFYFNLKNEKENNL